jgi:selenocysteine lyase/cysteine desulfurase
MKNIVGYDHIIKKEINASNALMSEGVIDNNLMSQMECVAFNKFGTIMGQTSIPGCQNIYSFVTQPHPSDIGTLLGQKNVVVRSGKLCAHLLSTHYSDKGLLRISVGPYTTMQDCRQLSSILNEVLADLY